MAKYSIEINGQLQNQQFSTLLSATDSINRELLEGNEVYIVDIFPLNTKWNRWKVIASYPYRGLVLHPIAGENNV